MEENNNTRLDELIRHKLETLEPPTPASAWEAFERYQSMAQEATDFDAAVRQKLDHVEAPADPSSWATFSVLLEKDYITDSSDTFDRIVYDRMEGYEVPYQSHHWLLLSDRLDLELSRLIDLVRIKSLEVAFLLLLCWGAAQLPTAHRQPTMTNKDEKWIAESEDWRVERGELKVESDKWNVENDKSKVKSERVIVKSGVWKVESKKLPPTTPLPLTTTYQLPHTNYQIPHTSYQLSNTTHQLPTTTYQLPTTNYHTPTTNHQPPSPPPHWAVSMYGAPEYNRVITPTQRIGDEKVALDRYALGYTGGLGLSWAKGRWAVESGFAYSSKAYRPVPILYQDGSFQQGYTSQGVADFQLDLIQIPLNVRYNFLWHNRWRIYAQAGTSLQAAIQSNYYIANEDAFDPDRSGISRSPSQGRRPQDLQDKDFPRGLLDGGSFHENAYLTANVGLGLEHYMSTRWSLFAQPTYYHSVFQFGHGVGPFNDRVHTMSILTGIRVRLEE